MIYVLLILLFPLELLLFLHVVCLWHVIYHMIVAKKILWNKNWYNNMTIIHLKFQRMLYVLRVLGTFTNTWPPYPNIGKNELILRNIYYCIAIFVLIAVWIPMIINAYKNRTDIATLMLNMSQIAAITEAIFNSILCRIKSKQLQVNMFFYQKYSFI